MNSQDKRKIFLGGGMLGLLVMIATSDPIADIRISHDMTSETISTIEAKLDVGLITFSFLHSWRHPLR